MFTRPDTLNRRPRFIRTATGRLVQLSERDLAWLRALHHHGPLPSSYLYALAGSSRKAAVQRLTTLFHEGGFITRPEWQTQTLQPEYNPIVYALTKAGADALKERGLWSDHAPAPAGTWKHRLMTACITASIEIECKKRDDLTYISQHEILARAGHPLRFEVPFTWEKKTISKALIPDALCGIGYRQKDGSSYYRFYFIEADRNTEGNHTSSFDRKSYLRTILQYREFIGHGMYKEPLKLTAGALVLNVTVSHEHMRNLLQLTADHSTGGKNTVLLYQTIDGFGPIFKPPAVLSHLVEGPWQRAGLPAFYLNSINGTL